MVVLAKKKSLPLYNSQAIASSRRGKNSVSRYPENILAHRTFDRDYRYFVVDIALMGEI